LTQINPGRCHGNTGGENEADTASRRS
jgi:hypothetical protein